MRTNNSSSSGNNNNVITLQIHPVHQDPQKWAWYIFVANQHFLIRPLAEKKVDVFALLNDEGVAGRRTVDGCRQNNIHIRVANLLCLFYSPFLCSTWQRLVTIGCVTHRCIMKEENPTAGGAVRIAIVLGYCSPIWTPFSRQFSKIP